MFPPEGRVCRPARTRGKPCADLPPLYCGVCGAAREKAQFARDENLGIIAQVSFPPSFLGRSRRRLGNSIRSRYPQEMPLVRGSTMSPTRRRFWVAVLAMFGIACLAYAPSWTQAQQGKSTDQTQSTQGKSDPKGKDKGKTGPSNPPKTQPSTIRQTSPHPLPHQVGGYLGNSSSSNSVSGSNVIGFSSGALQNALGFQGTGFNNGFSFTGFGFNSGLGMNPFGFNNTLGFSGLGLNGSLFRNNGFNG